MSDQNAHEQSFSQRQIKIMLLAMIISSVIYGFGMFKFIPMQNAVMTSFGVDESAYGYLNSANNWVVILLSVQMGFLIRVWPCKRSMIFGYGIAAVGMLMQIVTPGFLCFVLGRVVEGGGLALAYLATSSLLLNLVPRQKVGIWSGISILCSVAPQVLITKIGTTLMQNTGMTFRHIFFGIEIMYVIVILLCLLVLPVAVKINGVASSVKPTKEQTLRVFKDPSNWLVNISYIFFSLVSISFSAYVVKFLTLKGLEAGQAANIYSYTTLLGMASMLVFGWLSDKLGTKRKIIMAGYFAGAIALALLVNLPAGMMAIYVVVYGTLPRSIAGLTTACSTDIAEVPSDVPIVNSLRNEITQIGVVILTIALGYIIQFLGYQTAIYMLVGTMILGGICWIFVRKVP